MSGATGFLRFLKERAQDLKRIAWRTEGDAEVGDVESEAFVLASELEQKRGSPLDLTVPEDQQVLLFALFGRLVKFAEKRFRYAYRLDDAGDEDTAHSAGATLARSLQAPESSAPEARLERQQEANEQDEAIARSYTEAAAYALLLSRFSWSRASLAEYLRVAVATVNLRLRLATQKFEREASLFDGVSRVPSDFEPTRGRPITEREQRHLAGEQWEWSF